MKLDSNKPRILVALGGRSSEREVSINSGRAVAESLEDLGYQVGILDTGTGKLMQIPELDNLEIDSSKLSRVVNFPLTDVARHFSLVFIALHGKFGEDGGFQSMLDEVGIPYVGSGPLSSALAMNKKMSKIIFDYAKIPTPEFQVVKKENELKLPFPIVVKPVSQGSSFGVSICENAADFSLGFKLAKEFEDEIMIEKFIRGKEITVCVLDNEKDSEALPVIEIVPKQKFFNYQAKYDGSTQEIVPARIPSDITKKAQELAVKAHKILGCRHISRVDMIIDESRNLQVLEVNTIPGMTTESLFPKAAKAAGMNFDQLIERLISIALN